METITLWCFQPNEYLPLVLKRALRVFQRVFHPCQLESAFCWSNWQSFPLRIFNLHWSLFFSNFPHFYPRLLISLYPGCETCQIVKSFQVILKVVYGVYSGKLSAQNEKSTSLRFFLRLSFDIISLFLSETVPNLSLRRCKQASESFIFKLVRR